MTCSCKPVAIELELWTLSWLQYLLIFLLWISEDLKMWHFNPSHKKTLIWAASFEPVFIVDLFLGQTCCFCLPFWRRLEKLIHKMSSFLFLNHIAVEVTMMDWTFCVHMYMCVWYVKWALILCLVKLYIYTYTYTSF